jgi:hypothetical protein
MAASVAAANPRTRFIVNSKGRIVQAGGEAGHCGLGSALDGAGHPE